MKNLRFLALVFTFSCLAFGPRPAKAQDNINCGDDFDAPQNCGGCDYGYYFDGSCQGGGGGGGACPTSQGPFLTAYNDFETDTQGNVEIWATSSNSDGNYAEGVFTASVNGTLPNGGSAPSASEATSSQASITATISLTNYPQYADNSSQGQINFGNEVTWNCGISVTSFPSVTFRIVHTYEQWLGTSTPLGSSFQDCHYQQACLFSTPTCASSYDNLQPISTACAQYLNVFSLYVVLGNSSTCFEPSLAFVVGGVGPCT